MRTLRLGSSGSQARLWQLTHARFSKAVSVALVLGEWLSRDWIAAAALLALVVLPSVARAVDYDLWDYEPTVVGDAKTIGMWGAAIAHTNNPDSTLHRTEYFPAHGALLPHGTRGKLLLWRNQNQDQMILYDLNSGSGPVFYRTDQDTDRGNGNVHRLYCSGHTLLPEGSLLIAGQPYAIPAPPSSTDGICDQPGSNCDQGGSSPCNCKVVPSPPAASVFMASTRNSNLGHIIRVDDMPAVDSGYGGVMDSSRYYPAVFPLPSGNIGIAGGNVWRSDTGNDCCHTQDGKPFNRTWIEFDANDVSGDPWLTVENPMDPDWVDNVAVEMAMPFDYGKVYALPKGLVWLGWPGTAYGTSSRSSRLWEWPWPVELSAVDATDRIKTDDRVYCAPVVLSLVEPDYPQQRILMVGGGDPDIAGNPRATADLIDYAAGNPQWSSLSMNYARARTHAVLLPDGKVLVVGGANAPPAFSPVYAAEMFDPATNQFTVMASMHAERMYHALALLLPDGRVVAAGNDPAPVFGDYDLGNTYEIYWPPYLFNASNGYAVRPAVDDLEEDVFYGLPFSFSFTLDSGREVEEVVLMAPGSATHGVNFSQRRIVLEHEVDGGTVWATAPSRAEAAPPGYYMLFLLDDDGVPSEGGWVRLSRATSTAQTGSQVWKGTARLDRDFVVEVGDTLIIAPGAQVIAADWDADDMGSDADRVEIVVRGMLQGGDDAGDEVLLTSTGGEVGDWGGIVFRLTSTETGYGYADQPLSSLENVRIENAEYGIVFEDLCAPTLKGVTFDSITQDRHIFMKSDVVIPCAYFSPANPKSVVHVPAEWHLLGGTHVVASTEDVNDAWAGASGKVDLLPYGKLFTDANESGDPVYFRPDEVTPVGGSGACADWGGILMAPKSRGSKLRFADIGYAENPLFLSYPDSLTEVKHCRIHAFADVGIWVQGSLGLGGMIDSCLVYRDENQNVSLGRTGIYLDGADQFSLLRSQVWLTNLNVLSGGTGIEIRYGKTFCQTNPPPSHRTLTVQDNFVFGPGAGIQVGEAYVGLSTNWVCGSLDRDINLTSNWISGWKFAGMNFVQTSDVQVSCNVVADNLRGVDIYRDSEPTGAAIRFKENKLEATEPSAEYFALRTNDAVKTKLGPIPSGDRGGNRLTIHPQSTKFIVEQDPTPADSLNALNNYWFAGMLFTDPDSVSKRFEPLTASISFDLETNPQQVFCWPDTTGVQPPAGIKIIRLESVGSGRPSADTVDHPAEPVQLELGQPTPNPNQGQATLSLQVPMHATGTYSIEVFDVAGRRLWRVSEDVPQPGRYRIAWGGQESSGRAVAAGTYFLRVTGPGGRVLVRKLSVLR